MVVLVGLVLTVAALTRQFTLSAAAGTRLTLAHISLASVLAGLALVPPADFPPLMRLSLAAMALATAGIVATEAWLSAKIGAAGPFSRRMGEEVLGMLILSLAVMTWRSGAAGPWVVAVGALHYLRAAAAAGIYPALRPREHAPWRPWLIAGVVLALAAALLPDLPPNAATGLSAVALVLAIAAPATGLMIKQP